MFYNSRNGFLVMHLTTMRRPSFITLHFIIIQQNSNFQILMRVGHYLWFQQKSMLENKLKKKTLFSFYGMITITVLMFLESQFLIKRDPRISKSNPFLLGIFRIVSLFSSKFLKKIFILVSQISVQVFLIPNTHLFDSHPKVNENT